VTRAAATQAKSATVSAMARAKRRPLSRRRPSLRLATPAARIEAAARAATGSAARSARNVPLIGQVSAHEVTARAQHTSPTATPSAARFAV